MLDYDYTSKFKKDYQRMGKRGANLDLLDKVIEKIVQEVELGIEYKNHVLEPKNQIPKKWECHIGGRASDWLLIYYYPKNVPNFVLFDRTGSHNDLFK